MSLVKYKLAKVASVKFAIISISLVDILCIVRCFCLA